MSSLRVTKRNGNLEDVSFDKIVTRLVNLSNMTPPLKIVNPRLVAQKVISVIFDGITTRELDEQASRVAVEMTTTHPEYTELASRILISNHQKETSPDFLHVLRELHTITDIHGTLSPMIADDVMDIATKHASVLQDAIDYSRDYWIDYFGFKTLERAYLLRKNGVILERPQHLWMRVAIGIHGDHIEDILQTYHSLSQKKYTHATPTLFHAGTPHPQMSSCFLVGMKDDSIDGIYKTLNECALISKWGGGLGIHIHNIRAKGSYIRGTSGESNGIVPMLRVFNSTARYCDQGGGKRKGSFAIYLEPWHRDIEDFLKLKINFGNEEERARDLFYSLWVPDLFMKRVKEGGMWTLFCPDKAKGLSDCYGDQFEERYLAYEAEYEKYGGRQILAQKLWFQILQSQIETGTPYLLYKDAANRKSNQQNLGTICSSNLCAEIIEYSSPEETAVCNLASVNLQAFLHPDTNEFDFEELRNITRQLVKNLDRVIDRNFYPTVATKTSNFRHRPIGIGVQGLADVFARLKIAYDSHLAKTLNQQIFAHMYYAAVEASADLVQTTGLDAYTSFEGSPISKGVLQPDMWGILPETIAGELDWDGLRQKVQRGVRNSLLLALMPTASTSQILGNNESFEPFTTNIYTRRTLAGEFVLVNKYLVDELVAVGLWGPEMKDLIIKERGSVQSIREIPEEIRNRFKTVWEISQRSLIDLAADRGAFVCQSQSLNLYVADPTFKKLSSMHFYAWTKGLKTGIYYLRTKPVVEAPQVSIDISKSSSVQKEQDEPCEVCSA